MWGLTSHGCGSKSRRKVMSKEAAAVIKLADLKPEEVVMLRSMCSQVITAVNGLTDELSEPLLTMFKGLKDEYNAILSKLPLTDAVPAAQEASWHLNSFLSCLTSTQALLSYMTTRLGQVKAATNSAVDEKQIQSAIDARVASGDLVPKDKVTMLCSAAKDTGVQEEKSRAAQEKAAADQRAATIASRKQVLATNGLPIPQDEQVLLGTDDEFAAAQKRVKAQADRLIGIGVKGENTLAMSQAWCSAQEFDRIAAILEETGKAKSGSRVSEPFAKGADNQDPKSKKLIV